MSSHIEFGLMVMGFGEPEHVHLEAFGRLAAAAERHGFDTLWVGDHVAFPAHIPPEYPYSSTGDVRFQTSHNVFDPFLVLSYLAGATEGLQFGTNVCIVPYRHPVLLAKHVLTLDALTGGRFEFGVGAGWLQTEFDVLNVPYEERGTRTDEFLALFERVRESGEVAFDGPHHSFDRTGFYPRPARDRGPRIWVGGHSSAAFRRVAEYGDGWIYFSLTPDELEATCERILNAWSDYDRAGELEIAVMEETHVGTDTELPLDDPLVGPPESVVDGVRAYLDRGATTIIFKLYEGGDPPNPVTDVDAQVEQIERIGTHVIRALS